MPQTNLILKGFNPDPSICRDENYFYIATSTFEWFPGVAIYRSSDLNSWELITYALNDPSDLNMRGNAGSCGVWAPCLTYHDNTFYLAFTNVLNTHGDLMDGDNYIATTKDITKGFTKPKYINSSGFDPSIFHDDDKKYFLSNVWDHRIKQNGGFSLSVYIQELDDDLNLVGSRKLLTKGTDIGLSEGAHIYKVDGSYHLLLAEGGTFFDHAITMLKSDSIDGPWMAYNHNPIISADPKSDYPLQKTGHGSLVHISENKWALAYLCSRPTKTNHPKLENGYCLLGRETALTTVTYQDGFFYVDGNNAPTFVDDIQSEIKDYDLTKPLPLEFMTPRIPLDNNTINYDNDGIKLRGNHSLASRNEVSLLARRIGCKNTVINTSFNFSPTNFQQMAGLTMYYNELYHITCGYTFEDGEYIIKLETCINGDINLINKIKVNQDIINLQISLQDKIIKFYHDDNLIGEVESLIISDDFVNLDSLGFTGSFVGMFCYDLDQKQKVANFKKFKYEEKYETNN